MKEIEQVVTRYLKERDTDYAIMITGEWGSGKTYYIKQSLIDYINTLPFPDAEGAEKKYNAVLVSLNGLSSIDELPYLVAKSILPFLDGKVASAIRGAVGGVFNFFGIAKENIKEFSRLYEVKQDKVLIFDDLERVNYGKVQVKEILGAITQYVEGGRLKTIIISDDAKIGKEFNEFKEKTIRYTLKFQRPLSESFDAIVSGEENEGYLEYLKQQKELILQVFQHGRCKNLRTLIFVIDSFRELFVRVKDEKYASEILNAMLVSLLVYSIEYKNGNSIEDLKKLSELTSYLRWVPGLEQGENKKEYIDELWDKYNEIEYSYHYYPVINDYVIYGYIDHEKLNLFVASLRDHYTKQEETIEGGLYRKLSNWKLIKDEEFDQLITDVIDAVKNCKYNISETMGIYSFLLAFEEYGIEDFVVTEQIDKIFQNSIDSIIAREEYDKFVVDSLGMIKELHDVGCVGKQRRMIEYLKSINEQKRIKEDEKEIEGFLDGLKMGDITVIDRYMERDINHQLFVRLDAKEVSDILIDSPVEIWDAFREGLYSMYPGRYSFEMPELEYAFLKDLNNQLNDFLKTQTHKKMSSVWHQMLVNKIKSVLDRSKIISQ